mgnify:CR=1 FL=1
MHAKRQIHQPRLHQPRHRFRARGGQRAGEQPEQREFRDQAEKLFLVQKLGDHQWNVTQTALAIDTPRSNLYKKMEQYEIRRREPQGAARDDE